MVFTAQLTEEFAARTEKIKQSYIIDTLKKVDQLKEAISHKKTIVVQAIQGLQHIQFENDKGLVLDQLSSMMDDGSSMMTDRSLALDRVYKGKGDKSKDDMKKLKARNKREIEQFERDNAAATNPNAAQRMCGCEAFCNIF